MIRLEEVSKDYVTGEATVHALDQVTCAVDPGEFLSILGPSGSGKSTLLHVIGCLDRPSRGRYLLDGEDVSGLDPNRMAEIRNRRFGFVFQAFQLMPRSTALENVMLPLRFAGALPADRHSRARTLLEQVGLADRMGHRPGELSGGQQQRVAIARALANHPDVILADEPTGNLDSQSGQEILSLLEELNAAGQTVCLVTHDQELARRTPRVIRMLDGRIESDGPE